MSLGDNIKARRQMRGWSTYELADKAGTDQSSIWRYEEENVIPRPKALDTIAAVLGTDAATLQYGTVELNQVPMGKRRIPVLSYVQAGEWSFVNGQPVYTDEEDFERSILVDDTCSAASFAMIIRGESMTPEFRPGDQIVIDPLVAPTPGAYVVAAREDDREENGERAVFKQYAEVGVDKFGNHILELRSLNPLFPTWVSGAPAFRIVGTVVDLSRKYQNERDE